jgi:hypothetical protein
LIQISWKECCNYEHLACGLKEVTKTAGYCASGVEQGADRIGTADYRIARCNLLNP